MPQQYKGFALVETDTNGDTLMTYAYPSTPNEHVHKAALRKIPDASGDGAAFVWGSCDGLYFYVRTRTLEQGDEPELAFVERLSVVLYARECAPEKFAALSQVLLSTYVTTAGDGKAVLDVYLNGAIQGTCGGEADRFVAADFAVPATGLKELVSVLGMESILIFAAVVLKKRVAVFGSDAAELSSVMRSLPYFARHHNDWTVCPNVDLSIQSEVQDIAQMATKTSHEPGSVNHSAGPARYLGFSQGYDELVSREYMYDLLVDLDDLKVTVSQGAAPDLALTKVHKQIALNMVEWAADEALAEHEFVQRIAAATEEAIDGLKQIAQHEDGDGTVASGLGAMKLHTNLARFYRNLAQVEGL